MNNEKVFYKKNNYIALIIISLFVIISTLNALYQTFLVQYNMNEKIHNFMSQNNYNNNDYLNSVQIMSDTNHFMTYLTNKKTLEEKSIIFNNKNYEDITGKLNNIKDNLLKDSENGNIKRTYYSIQNIYTSDIMLKTQYYLPTSLSQILPNDKEYKINTLTVDFLFEDSLEKRLYNNRNIIQVDNKKLVNEIKDFSKIKTRFETNNVNLDSTTVLAFFVQDKKEYLVYRDLSHNLHQYIVNENGKISQPKNVDDEVKNAIKLYIK